MIPSSSTHLSGASFDLPAPRRRGWDTATPGQIIEDLLSIRLLDHQKAFLDRYAFGPPFENLCWNSKHRHETTTRTGWKVHWSVCPHCAAR